MIRLTKIAYTTKPTQTSQLMRPPQEVYPLFVAVGVGLMASVATIYSTMTRDGSDVLLNKSKRYYWNDTPNQTAQRISRNPFIRDNTRS